MKLEQLKPGQSLATKLKKVANNKIQVEIASFCDKPVVNVAALFNAGDERFAQQKPRRAWQTGTIKSISDIFGIDSAKLEALAEGAEMEINVLNPSVATSNGKVQLNVQVREYTMTEVSDIISRLASEGKKTDSYDYLLANADTKAKKNPSTGEFILAGGEYVFSTVSVCAGIPDNKWVNAADYAPKATSTVFSAETTDVTLD